MTIDRAYGELLYRLLESDSIPVRNGNCRRLIGPALLFYSTPLLQCRQVAWKQSLYEMEWFLSGSNKISDLHESVHMWWKPWTNENGHVATGYAERFRRVDNGWVYPLDQIKQLIDGLRSEPYSRRHVVSTWDCDWKENGGLPCCHGTVIQCFVNRDALSMVMYQRSADVMCGLPHNLLQYRALLLWLAEQTDLVPYWFHWIGGDVHLYEQHEDLARRTCKEASVITDDGPQLIYKATSDAFKADDFSLSCDYVPRLKEKAVLIP